MKQYDIIDDGMEDKILVLAMNGGNLLAGDSCFLFNRTFKSSNTTVIKDVTLTLGIPFRSIKIV